MFSRNPTTTRLEIDAPLAAVFAVVGDASTYPEWLVGAQRIRSVDPTWPEVGGRFHHTIGFGPFHLRDATESLELDALHRLRLRAGMGSLGAAIVTFELTESESGTVLEIAEQPDRGPFRHVWRIAEPVVRTLLWGRNAVSLTNLRSLVEARVAAGRLPDQVTEGAPT